MNNEDLQRLYNIGVDRELPGDFVRRDKNGKIPGAGATLNKYTFTVNTKPSVAQVTKILNVLNSAIRIVNINIRVKDGMYYFMLSDLNEHKFKGYSINAYSNVYTMYSVLLRDDLGASGISANKTEFKNSAFLTNETTFDSVSITYLNDTEITE